MSKQIAISTMSTNPIYREYAEGYKGRYLFLFGGAGSGKSVFAVQNFIQRMVNESGCNHRFLFIRKVANTINDSLFALAKKILTEQGFYSYCKFNKVEKSIIFLPNGNEIIMKGLDDSEKIKSIDGITGIFVEEVTELEETDFLQLDLRMRGKSKSYFQYVAAFNPVNKEHWLLKYVEPQLLKDLPNHVSDLSYIYENKVWEFDRVSESGDKLQVRVLNTNYKDNRKIDDSYKSQLKLLASISPEYSEVYEHGRWGVSTKGDKFIYEFREGRHLSDSIVRNESSVLHFTVDFNVRPYMSGLVIELQWVEDGFWNGHKDYWDLRIVDELSMEHPRNDAFSLGEELENRYDIVSGFFMYGDVSGNKSLGVKDTKSHFEDLKKGLGHSKYNCIERIPSQNPRFKSIAPNSLGRKAFCNLLFKGTTIPVRLRINSKKCTNFVKDIKQCLQDGDGKMQKKKNKDGVEERGHHLDAFQYFVCHPETLGYLAKIR